VCHSPQSGQSSRKTARAATAASTFFATKSSTMPPGRKQKKKNNNKQQLERRQRRTGDIEHRDLRNDVDRVGAAVLAATFTTLPERVPRRCDSWTLRNGDLRNDITAAATTSSEPVGLLSVPGDAIDGAMAVCGVAYSGFGEDLWLQAPPYIEPPVPSPDVLRDSYAERMRFTSWAHAWHQHVANTQREMKMPVMPPCSWCGTPTGDWCEACPVGCRRFGMFGRAHAICTKCEATIRECRLCRLKRQVKTEHDITPKVHQQDDSVWAGRSKCAACGDVGAGYKLCGSCLCFRFCSDACSNAVWPEHKKICRWLREPQPLIVIGASRMPLAEQIRIQGNGYVVPPIRVFDVSTSDFRPGARASVD